VLLCYLYASVMLIVSTHLGDTVVRPIQSTLAMRQSNFVPILHWCRQWLRLSRTGTGELSHAIWCTQACT